MDTPRTVHVVVRRNGQQPGQYVLVPGEYVIGRDPDCAIPVDDNEVSRHHAKLKLRDGELVLEDLGSANGTFVDGQRVAGVVSIKPNQKVQLGTSILEISRIEETDQTLDPQVEPRESAPPVRVQNLQEYELGGKVAQGGMGAILRARDLALKRTVAMKVALENSALSPELLQRFKQEAEITGQLEHPGIVPVHELGTDEQGKAFYTMKFVQGVTLKDVLHGIKTGEERTIAKYPLAHLLTIFQKVCDAVAFAHSKGVVHRDLKPENIMIGDYGEVLVMDWGLAKLLGKGEPAVAALYERREHEDGGHRPPLQDSGLTMQGMVMGTPQFMAPEQADGKVDEIDGRTDIFSLGAILYNILTLHPPVNGGSVAEVLQKVRTGDIPAPTSYNPTSKIIKAGAATTPRLALSHCPDRRIPSALSAVCMKALALKREDRYQTVKELQKDIEAFQGGFATLAEQAGTLKLLWLLIKRHKVEAAAVLIILVLITGFMIKVITSERRARATLTELRATTSTFSDQALALIKEHKFDDALQKITYAIKLAPERADYHVLKGNILQSLLRFSEAEQAYAEAIRWNKNEPFAEANIQLCQKLRQQNEGRAELLPTSLSELQAAMRQQQRLDEAVALAMRQHKDNGQAYETWKAVLLKNGYIPTGEIGWRYSMDEAGMITLNLAFLNPASLAPLKGMPVKSLEIQAELSREIRLTDLSPLKGMPLESLNLIANIHITDLSPLKSMPLKRLILESCNSVVDLSPIKGMQIEELWLGYVQVSDLSVLRGMPLRLLRLDNTRVTDVSPLEGMPLKFLSLANSPVADISPLHGMPLETLYLNATAVSDLHVLRRMPLKDLELQSCENLQDLTPLADCPTLERLKLPAQCKDIESLRRLPHLRRLSYEHLDWDKAQTPAEFWKEYDAKKAKGQ